MTAISSTNGFVLAGGASRRMGRDKAELQWGAGSLLDHMTRLLSNVAQQVFVSGRDGMPDRLPGKGPLGGILTILEATQTENNIVLAVDLPLLTPDFLRMFHTRFLASQQSLVACCVGGKIPLCLGLRKSLLQEVASYVAEDKLSIQGFVTQASAEILEEEELGSDGFYPPMFLNLNAPEDLVRVRDLSLISGDNHAP